MNTGICTPYFDPKMPIVFWSKNLPHWEQTGKIHFLTFRLGDSMPQEMIRQYKEEKNRFMIAHPQPWNQQIYNEYHNLISNPIEKYLDSGYGDCVLKDAAVRQILIDAIDYYDGKRYLVLAYVIMPNPVHMLIVPAIGYELYDSIGSVMRFSARGINRITEKRGRLWQPEPFDTIIRNHTHYTNTLEYIRHNPSHLEVGTYTFGGLEFRL